MNRISSTTRVTIGLAGLSMSVLLAAQTLGFIPDRRGAVKQGRSALCEALAINCSLMAARGEIARMESSLRAIARRNHDVLSAAVRYNDGLLLVEVGEHAAHWNQSNRGHSSDSQIYVPITAGNEPWGTVEVRFRPLRQKGLMGILNEPLTSLALFVLSASYFAFAVYLRKMLQHMDPSKVVPDRVRAALDTFAEGLLVLDKEERIVLANKSFAQTIGESSVELQGRRVADLPWIDCQDQKTLETPPWSQAVGNGKLQSDVMLGLKTKHEGLRTFKVNASPIVGGSGEHRGALASFNDVTLIETNRAELRRMLELLKNSRDEINRQNQELQILATQDPLTGCLNRRSFFAQFDAIWNAARRHNHQLSCIMVDIDYFKSINDQHGHATGDEVLKNVAEVLKSNRRGSDLVARYGGEEFCILLPYTDEEGAISAAEGCRKAIEAVVFEKLSVTASLGISSLKYGAGDPQELLNQADKCLYMAKRNGRNQVVRWDQLPTDFEMDEQHVEEPAPADTEQSETSMTIPFQAVTALVSALAYRDSSTAEHSRRVADLCVAAASGLMSLSDVYILEIAALLHDIGKIGVPDAILLKPGSLDEHEWKVMRIHDRIGVEILNSTFACRELTRIVETHHAWYDGNEQSPELPEKDEIPLGARILTIADAYDAMVSDRVYRKGRSEEEAFAELRRCAGRQFDPRLVERFIESVQARDQNRNAYVPQVSKQTALRIGLEIERLACALDAQDIFGLAALAGRLKTTATKYGVPQIAELAEQLQQSATDEPDLIHLVQLTNDLLNLCRSTQNAYLKSADEPEVIGPPQSRELDAT